ncbi:LacI family DNA-binding transcriptional regulator [Pseudalkalibacillus sp. SCS-8]|uniref:LacI family DNA-binding transcriptional regulator n=1 Tax=Pseudalkalibacillus nanhaiensis TaxID=3115291 RepID=UPI0032DB818D
MATIKDIAKSAGVSVTTVSRALNGYSDVSEKTRAKIKQIANELSYSPNGVARSLVMNRTHTIGLLVSELNRQGSKDNFTFEILCGINDFSSKSGYDLVLFSTSSAEQKLKTYTQLCRERQVDGVILQGIKTDDPYLEEVLESDIPCVLIDIPIRHDRVGSITTDNRYGAKSATEHLIQLKHRNIAMINGHGQAFVSQERLTGYKNALDNASIPYKDEWVINGQFDEDIAKEKTIELLKKYPEITAIFCASDLMALGVLRAAKELELNVPTDLSVAGYDDIILANYATPSLTTVSQDIYQMGYEAASLLVDMLDRQSSPQQRILPTKLIKRESTDIASSR